MTHFKSISLLLIVAVLSGCAAQVPVVNLKALPVDDLQAIKAMRMLSATQLIGKQFTVVGLVEGNSCQHLLTDPPATRTAAIEQVKYHAVVAKADAIANVQCGGREEVSVHTNCWQLISCTAEAVTLQ